MVRFGVFVEVQVNELVLCDEAGELAVVFHTGFICVEHQQDLMFVGCSVFYKFGEVGEELFSRVWVGVSCGVEQGPLLFECGGWACSLD